TTMATRLAAALDLPRIELDAINWQPGWRALSRLDPDEFRRRVDTATAGERWVLDGNYSAARELVWGRGTHLVWLDYARRVVMARVIRRSLPRVFRGAELWAGNRESWRSLLRPSHPIAWAWTTWRKRRQEFEQLIAEGRYAQLEVLRLRRPGEAENVLERLQG